MKIEIGLKDFPDNISIKFFKEFLETLFKGINLTQKKLAQITGFSENTISQWKLNKGSKNNRFMPISVIKQIVKSSTGLKWKEVEKNVIAYRSNHDTKIVFNPKLPIKDSKELREVVIHIMADGCAESYGAYYNYPAESKKEFIIELKKVFGDIETKTYWDHVNFPMCVAYILSNYFKINFLSKSCRVPKKFFYNKEHLIGIIRAMIIDEGTIDGSNVRIDSCNIKFLKDIKEICSLLKISCGKTWKSDGPIYRFNILAESINQLYENIKPIPIKNKDELLKFACENQKRYWKYKLPGQTKKEILLQLMNGPLTSVELASKLKMLRKIINKNTKKLESLGIIKVIDKKVYTNLYIISNLTLAKNFVNDPSKFLKGNKLKNYGITQLKILQQLQENKKCKYAYFLEILKINKGALYKCLNGMIKKKLINKIGKNYGITKKGKIILSFPENKARYLLYANVKNLENV